MGRGANGGRYSQTKRPVFAIDCVRAVFLSVRQRGNIHGTRQVWRLFVTEGFMFTRESCLTALFGHNELMRSIETDEK